MSNSFNFFAPFFQVFLIPPGGEEVPLWQGETPQAATDAGFVPVGLVNSATLAVVTELTVEDGMGAAFLIKVTLSPSYEDGLAMLSSNMIQRGLSRLKVRFGYMGAGQVLSPWFVGLLQNPGFTIGTDVQITLEAHPDGAPQAATQSATRQFVDMSRKEIAEAVAAGSGLQDLIFSIKWPEELKPLEKRLLEDVKISAEQGGASDLLTLAKFIEDALLNWSIKTDQANLDATVIVVKSRDDLNSGLTKRVFRLFGPPKASKTSAKLPAGVYGGVAGESSGIFPILSVSNQSQALAFVGATRGHIQPEFNSATKVATPPAVKDINTEAPAAVTGPAKAGKSAKGPATGNDIYADLDPVKGGGGAIKLGDPSSPIQEAKNLAALVKEGATAGIILQVETVGIPDFEPGEVVEMQGLGIKIDGMYSVHKVAHTLNSSGYVCKFEARSNGSYKEEFAAESPSPTTAPTETEAGTTVNATEG